MNRREAIASVVGAVGVAGVDVKAKAVASTDDVVLFILEYPGYMPQVTARLITENMELALKGTPLEHVKTLVLGDGMTLRALTRKGFANIASEADEV